MFAIEPVLCMGIVSVLFYDYVTNGIEWMDGWMAEWNVTFALIMKPCTKNKIRLLIFRVYLLVEGEIGFVYVRSRRQIQFV